MPSQQTKMRRSHLHRIEYRQVSDGLTLDISQIGN